MMIKNCRELSVHWNGFGLDAFIRVQTLHKGHATRVTADPSFDVRVHPFWSFGLFQPHLVGFSSAILHRLQPQSIDGGEAEIGVVG